MYTGSVESRYHNNVLQASSMPVRAPAHFEFSLMHIYIHEIEFASGNTGGSALELT